MTLESQAAETALTIPATEVALATCFFVSSCVRDEADNSEENVFRSRKERSAQLLSSQTQFSAESSLSSSSIF